MDLNNLDPNLRLQDTAITANAYSPHTSIAPYPNVSRSLALSQPQYDSPLQHQSYLPLPHIPGSGRIDGGQGDGTQDVGPNDPKRPRACEACRGLKVRCEPDQNNLDGPCKRCAKANRNCIVTLPSRKRQKKTDNRVAELEKKIDTLTASLHQQHDHPAGGQIEETSNPTASHPAMNAPARVETVNNSFQQVANDGYAGWPPQGTGDEWSQYSRAPEAESRKDSSPSMVVAGLKRKHHTDIGISSASTANTSRGSSDPSGFLVHGNPTKPAPTHEYSDVIDRGLLSADAAAKMFECYVEKMAPHMPAVVFKAGTTASEVRRNKPTLFLSILSAASGSNHPELQRVLTKEVMAIYAERVIVNGEKTLELVQALLVSTLWYWPPEHFEELKFYQLIHIAAVMAIDIGMGKLSKGSKAKQSGLWRDNPWRRTPYPDPESVEARRTWLGCYFLCCNASMGLRRPNLIRWSPFMAESVTVLENSPDALPSDRIYSRWIKSQQIAEEVGTQFSMDDPCANVSIADPKILYALKGFERELDKWSQVESEIKSPTLKMTEHVVTLYMHEIAMHVDHNVDELAPPFTEAALRGRAEVPQDVALTPAHIDALSVCLTSIDGIFETFLKFDIDTVRCLPVANFVRVAYAVVVLIKMYFAAATPNSELGKVIDKDNMKVEQYLDDLVHIFKASAADEKSRPSAKFLMVLLMLKTWFHRQREGKPQAPESSNHSVAPPTEPLVPAKDSASNSMQVQTGPQGVYGPANTPLQLLSEVATGTSSHPRSASEYLAGSNDWQQQQNPYQNYGNHSQIPLNQGYSQMAPSIEPTLGMDFNYNMGDNFEQAMGLALGAGDYAYMSDDSFFGGLMDGSGMNFEGAF